MHKIVLTDEQSRQFIAADRRVTLVDSEGRVVGITRPPLFTPEELAEAKRQWELDEPEFSVAEKNRIIREALAELETTTDGV